MKRTNNFLFDKVFAILVSYSNKIICAKHILFYSFIAIFLIIYLILFYPDFLRSSLKLN